MRTREVIAKVKNFQDYYGFDIVSTSELKTKEDCLEALQAHKSWLEEALIDALTGVDKFIKDLGIEFEDWKE